VVCQCLHECAHVSRHVGITCYLYLAVCYLCFFWCVQVFVVADIVLQFYMFCMLFVLLCVYECIVLVFVWMFLLVSWISCFVIHLSIRGLCFRSVVVRWFCCILQCVTIQHNKSKIQPLQHNTQRDHNTTHNTRMNLLKPHTCCCLFSERSWLVCVRVDVIHMLMCELWLCFVLVHLWCFVCLKLWLFVVRLFVLCLHFMVVLRVACVCLYVVASCVVLISLCFVLLLCMWI